MLIGIAGLKRSGKDTVADYLVKNFNFAKRPLSHPLKKICRTLFKFNDEQLYGDDKEKPDKRWNYVTPRKAMQFIGTDLLRNQMNELIPHIHNDIFIENFKIWYEKHNKENIVIPDIRFKNEHEMIKELGGITIKVERPGINKIGEIDTHESENIDFNCTYNICNIEGNLLNVYYSIEAIMNTHKIMNKYSNVYSSVNS